MTYGHNCTFCSVSLQEDSPRYNSLVRNAGVFWPMSRNDSPPLHSWLMQHMRLISLALTRFVTLDRSGLLPY